MFHVTERLLLRPAWPEDADALFGGIADEAIVPVALSSRTCAWIRHSRNRSANARLPDDAAR